MRRLRVAALRRTGLQGSRAWQPLVQQVHRNRDGSAAFAAAADMTARQAANLLEDALGLGAVAASTSIWFR
ncbi:hypothetical protein [Nonomuraea jabiensis]|uniref:hypothetical protein n=1 Tax=Nonomuraea jabiensis TaxID=882448 RepID=UPI003D745AE1